MSAPICPVHKCPMDECFREHYPQAFRHPPGYDPDCGDGASLKAAYEFLLARNITPPETGSEVQQFDGEAG